MQIISILERKRQVTTRWQILGPAKSSEMCALRAPPPTPTAASRLARVRVSDVALPIEPGRGSERGRACQCLLLIVGVP
jgi:hypothetical protein